MLFMCNDAELAERTRNSSELANNGHCGPGAKADRARTSLHFSASLRLSDSSDERGSSMRNLNPTSAGRLTRRCAR